MAAFERILLTGGAGFVGRHLSAALAQAFPDAVRVMLLRPGEAGGEPAFDAVSADLTNTDETPLNRIIADLRPDLVLHLAGQSAPSEAARFAELTWRVNVGGAIALAGALARHAPEAVTLFASTAAVYGLSFRDGVLTEDAPLRPMEVYGRSKAAAECALADVLGPRARLIIARPVNHSGPGQRSDNFVLSSFATQIAAIESGRSCGPLKVGNLERARDFLDVRDVVDAYLRLIRKARELPERVSVFNIASGDPRRIGSLLEDLRGLSAASFDVEVDPRRLRPPAADIESIACDASRLRAATGWRPRHPLRDMMRALLDERRAAEAGGAA